MPTFEVQVSPFVVRSFDIEAGSEEQAEQAVRARLALSPAAIVALTDVDAEREPHSCPYACQVDGDYSEEYCTCSIRNERNCADEI